MPHVPAAAGPVELPGAGDEVVRQDARQVDRAVAGRLSRAQGDVPLVDELTEVRRCCGAR